MTIEARELIKTYRNGAVETPVLKGIDFSAKAGEWVAIMGRSGAGKSTLMYQLSLLDEPSGGSVLLDGKDTRRLSERERSLFRLARLGYVFQDYALLPELTAIENVVVPLLMQGVETTRAEMLAGEALGKVGLGGRLGNLPSQLSGGEQQRVSIARAIAHKPEILFADEPTANLDRESSQRVMEIFRELHGGGQTIIMVTHEEEYGALAQRIVHLDDGRVVDAPAHRRAHR